MKVLEFEPIYLFCSEDDPRGIGLLENGVINKETSEENENSVTVLVTKSEDENNFRIKYLHSYKDDKELSEELGNSYVEENKLLSFTEKIVKEIKEYKLEQNDEIMIGWLINGTLLIYSHVKVK